MEDAARSPYSDLAAAAFWRSCRKDPEFRVSDLYQPTVALSGSERIAAAGSCFAQHLSRRLKGAGLPFVDTEPAPEDVDEATAARYGYGVYSARYGNVYTPRQLDQLLSDAVARRIRRRSFWTKGDRVYDALRPGVEPNGLPSERAAQAMRVEHLDRVAAIFRTAEVFVFTLGMTEAWVDRRSGTVFPTAPGVFAGEYDPSRHGLANFSYKEVLRDTTSAIRRMRRLRPGLKVFLTVSPVPLTATAEPRHVLFSTISSKSRLRAAAEEIARNDPLTDYVPTYDLIAGAPFSDQFFEDNWRSVNQRGVDLAMGLFFGAHGLSQTQVEADLASTAQADGRADAADDVICEEVMLEDFRP
ncbi:MAG: GSCFA domain-containing protein [Pseudomonadota bacterium]